MIPGQRADRKQGYEKPDGTKHYPSTLLLTSFPAPTFGKPTFLRQRNVKTIFHELGHSIHDLVGQTRFAPSSGTAVTQDFVEIPSKMLENWCWDPSILHSLSKHYSCLSPEYKSAWNAGNPEAVQPPEKAPLEQLEKFAKTRNMRWGSRTRGLLATAKFDLLIHGAKNIEDAEKMDLGEIYQRVRREVMGLYAVDGDNWGAEHARSEHLFQGYDAGHYSYVM